MEIRRPPISMRIPARPSQDARHPTTSRHSSVASSLSSSHSQGPMPIPGASLETPPPPLPPPRYNEELDRGIDAAWSWSNSGIRRERAPIKPGSSLCGGYMHDQRDTRKSSDADDMELDERDRRRPNFSASCTPSTSHVLVGAGVADGHTSMGIPSLVRRPASPNPSNQRLHGERPLAQVNFNRSSQAYDQSLLSKIGKPNSPPRQPSNPADTMPSAYKLSLQTKDSSSSQLLNIDSASTDSARWFTSPISSGTSPGLRPTWKEYNMDPRSPSSESMSTLLVLDPELFLHTRSANKHHMESARLTNDDDISIDGRSQRGSYDQAMFGTEEADLANDESSNLPHRVRRQESGQGLKRRAKSPPAETISPNDFPNKSAIASVGRSPAASYRPFPSYGSVSSVSSSVRHSSHTSSFAPSLAGSSMTSISSYDRPSPLDPNQPHPLLTSGLVSSPNTTSIGPFRKPHTAHGDSSQNSSNASRKMSIQTAVNETRGPTLAKIGNHYVCDCCPKKPRKFEIENDLRAHQMEKQYVCQYCNNRFKNKNEAERHQNSLHLRRQSWSCAAISNYNSVFHPSTSASVQGQNGPLADVCGFCGEDFPNHPTPDWDRRIDHLTTVHKFGECNQTKKFFRADHFRQHLKHTHAGQSGKWTSVLESVCLREESVTEPAGVSPTGSEGGLGRGPSSLPAPADIPMGGFTINEAREET